MIAFNVVVVVFVFVVVVVAFVFAVIVFTVNAFYLDRTKQYICTCSA